MHLPGLFINFLPSIGFLLALVLLAHVLRQRRSPSSTLAWLMAIVFVPYLGVPLYMIFGGRKMTRMAGGKKVMPIGREKGATAAPEAKPAPSPIPCLFPGGFPPTHGNTVSMLTAGSDTFRLILKLIREAKDTLHVTTFILGRDDTGRAIISALADRARHGVKVRLLLDALGSMPIRKPFYRRLVDAGGQVAFFMPMVHLPFRGRANLRNHRKMIIADQKRGVVGGMNLAEDCMGAEEQRDYWLDLALLVQGPSVGQLYQIFQSDWRFAAGETLDDMPPTVGHGQRDGGTLQFTASGPDVPQDTLRDDLLAAFFGATRRIWIMTPYFVPDDLTLEALCIAARRGVDVRIVVPARSNHRLADIVRKGYLSQLQESGGRVLLYMPRMLHAKLLCIDGRVAVTGSINMDMRSLLLNYEVALCVQTPDTVQRLDRWMRRQMRHCRPRKAASGAPMDLLEGMSRLVAPLL